jgi:hypothetical protein
MWYPQLGLAVYERPIPETTRSRPGSAASLLLELRVRIPPKHGRLSLMSAAFCQDEVPTTVRSPVQGFLPSVVCMSVIVKPRQ